MGTMTITSAGFNALPAQPPENWPSDLTWPAGYHINDTWTYTMGDGDMQVMMAWIATNYQAQLTAKYQDQKPPITVTALDVYRAWWDGFMKASTNSTQQHHTTDPVIPPPISIT